VELQRPVDDVVEDAGAEELDQRDVGAGGARAVAVDLPRRVERHQPRCLHLRRGVRDPVLHGLLVAQQATADRPVERPLAHHVEGTPRNSEPAHAVVDASRDEPVLGDQEPLALLPEQGLRAEPDTLVADLRVPAEHPVVLVRLLHVGDVSDEHDARRLDGDDEHRGPLVGCRVGVGHGHHDQEVRDRPVGREPLVPVEDVAVAVAHGPRAELRRVRAGRVRLRHRERGPEPALEQRVEPPLLLLVRAGEGEDLAVARVRRLAAERRRGVDRRAEDLVHQPELDLAEALAPELRREVRGPQPPLLHLFLQRGEDAVELVLSELVRDRLDRPDLLADEGPHPLELGVELGIGRKVPGHPGVTPS
jgi:hypothetical protein